MLGTLCTTKSLLGVYSALVRSQMAGRVERHVTFLSGGRIKIGTREWLFIQVDCCDVLLKGGVLAEGLVAGRVFGAPVFVSSIMGRKMPSKP